jgi:uncharacterized membrane protein
VSLLYSFILLLLPALIIFLSTKIKWIKLIGAVVVCYFVGITLGNLLPSDYLKLAAGQLSEISVLVAIPLLLFTTDLMSWLRLARPTLISFILVLFSVTFISSLSYFIFRDQLTEATKISGMLVGVFTGGTPNMVAIGKALEVSESVFVILNAADLMVSGLILFLLMGFGPRLYQKILKPFDKDLALEIDEAKAHRSWSQESLPSKIKDTFKALTLTAAIVGSSILSSQLFFSGLNVVYIILSLTALSISASFITKVRELNGSYEIGQYALLIFCVSIGSMANIQDMLNTSGIYLLYLTLTLVGSMALHLLLCFIFKIDSDTALITSVSGIYGPAFIGPFASLLKNKEILVSGVTCGLVGYAVGTYLGISLHYLLAYLSQM